MANKISEEYLKKVRFAIRRNANDKVDEELRDIIEECQEDMISKGVSVKVATDESNKRVLGCQRAFARWRFGINGDDVLRNREDYWLLVDELRKNQIEITEEI